ncbi:MAG: CHAT domain-containing protein [Thermoanaerobaculia bacterium]|nr:CHAT domain-containing protein [Thermoanaerobaculia bacterium]
MATLPGLRPTSLHPRWLLLAPVLLGIWLFRTELSAFTPFAHTETLVERAQRDLRAGFLTGAEQQAAAALVEQPDDPVALTAYAEVQLALVERDREREAFRSPRALELALEAVERAPEATEGQRAFARAATALGLPGPAHAAWRRVANLEPAGPAADEVRAGLAENERLMLALAEDFAAAERTALERAFAAGSEAVRSQVELNPESARRYVEETVAAHWSAAVVAGRDEEAQDWAARGIELARALEVAAGDPLPRAISEELETATGRRRTELARAHQVRAGTDTSDTSDATRLARAAQALRALDSPYTPWVEVELTVEDYYNNRYPEALARLNRVASFAVKHGYPNLEARALWIRGLVRMVRGELRAALADYQRAILLYQRTGERGHRAYLHALAAKNRRWLGDHEGAWSQRLVALRELAAIRPDRRFTVLDDTADALRAEGAERAALLVLGEQLAGSRKVSETDPRFADLVLWTLVDRAPLARRFGSSDAAKRDLAEARTAFDALPSTSALRGWAGQALALVEVELGGDPEERIAAAENLIAALESKEGDTKDAIEINAARRIRAAAERDAGQLERASASLVAAQADVERLLVELGDESYDDRAQLRAEHAGLVRERISLEALDRRRPVVALEVVAAARNRTLIEEAAMGTGRAGEAPAESTLPATPEAGQALLVYADLRPGAGLGAWVSTRAGLEFEALPLAPFEVARWARRVRLESESDAPPVMATGEAARALLPAALARLAPGTRLTIVPGPGLFDIPWAALLAASGIEAISEVTVSPSLGRFPARVQPEGPARRPGAERVLIVAGTVIDLEAFGHLSHLEKLPAQAELLRGLHPGATVLVGEAATPSAVLAALAEHEVVYYLGHALASTGRHQPGGLVLAPEEKGPYQNGLLPAAAILRAPLGHLDRVYLDACETGRGTRPGGQEMASLATAFLAAGAQTVKASLIPVLDSATRALGGEKKGVSGPSKDEEQKEQYIWQTYSVLREGDGG